MKQLLGIFALLLFSNLTIGQTVIHGSDIIDGKLKKGYYLLLKIEGKTLSEEWKEYLSAYGKISETEKNRYSLSKFKNQSVSDEDLGVESKVSELNGFTKIFCTVEGVKERSFSEQAFDEFLLDFAENAQYRELVRLAELDLEEAANYLEDSERDQKKVERSLENNLKYQEKYGKYLDESPEKMVSLLDEKKSIVDQQISSDLDEDQAEALTKEAKRKEREISKNQRNEAKYAKRLNKKEAEFDELRNELFAAKRTLTTADELVSAKKLILVDLKKQ
jgi:DNA-directed RNA polymerase subunit F